MTLYLSYVEPFVPCLQSRVDVSQKYQILQTEKSERSKARLTRITHKATATCRQWTVSCTYVCSYHLILSLHLLYQGLQCEEESGRVSILTVLDNKLLKNARSVKIYYEYTSIGGHGSCL